MGDDFDIGGRFFYERCIPSLCRTSQGSGLRTYLAYRRSSIDIPTNMENNVSTVHGPWTQINAGEMKSQDILVLLKLVALERIARPGVDPSAIGSFDEPAREAAGDVAAEDSAPYTASRPGKHADPHSVRGIANATGIGKSEVSNALARCYENGLAKPPRGEGSPVVNRRGLEEFLSFGIRYVFPAKTLGLARGIPTGLTAPIFHGELRGGGEQIPVWPDPHGDAMGLAVEPLYKTVTMAVREDQTLYKLLAAVDSIRIGQARERKLAIKQLQQLFDF